MNSLITGIGHYLPEKICTSEEIELRAGYDKFGIKPGLCRFLTGCESRHYAADGEYCSDVAAKAGAEAMENAGVPPSEIDALLFCSVTQDFAEPATANVIADKLNIRNAFAFDIKNACNAFLSGVDVADSLIQTGKAETVLVVSGEVFSKWIKFDYESKESVLESLAALSLGDGGGAFVIQAAKDPNRGIIRTRFHTVPQYWNNNVVWGGGVMYPHDGDKMFVPGTTKKIIDQSGDISINFIPEMLKLTGWDQKDLDCFVVSQVADWILRNVKAHMNLDEHKVIKTLKTTGNVGSSNIPLAAYKGLKDGIIKKGSRVLMLSGGVGMSIGGLTCIF